MIKAYKAFDKDLRCRNFQFEIGVKYINAGKIEMCKNGFHSCGDILSTSVFYKFSPKHTRWAEVEIPRDSLYDKNANKFCSKSISIIKEISYEEILKEHFERCGGSLDLRGCTLPENFIIPSNLMLKVIK